MTEHPVVVSVELFGAVRDLAKESKVEVELSDRAGATYRMIIEGLADRYGPVFRDRLLGANRPSSLLRVYADGMLVTDLDQPLPSDERQPMVRVIVMAAAGGG